VQSPVRVLVLVFAWLFVACGQGDGGAAAGSGRAAQTAPAVSAPSAPAGSASGAASAAVTAAPSASASAESAPTDRPQPFLWVAKKGATTSHLFGTMHLGTDAEKELHPMVFERLDAARVVVFEANAFDVDPFAAVNLAMLKPGESVRDKLSPGRWQILVDRVGGILMPESTLERFKPWMLVTLVLQDMLPKTEPMDLTLYERAKGAKKEIVFLETLEEQVKMVDASMDTKLLDDTLGDLPAAEKMLLDLATAYRGGDLDKLNALTFDPDEIKKHPAMFDTLLYERNRRWVPKISPLFQKGDVFVAVGAAHLLGDKSVVALLTKQGYEIDRVEKPVTR
jgi:hypothetical protein